MDSDHHFYRRTLLRRFGPRGEREGKLHKNLRLAREEREARRAQKAGEYAAAGSSSLTPGFPPSATLSSPGVAWLPEEDLTSCVLTGGGFSDLTFRSTEHSLDGPCDHHLILNLIAGCNDSVLDGDGSDGDDGGDGGGGSA